MSMVCYDTPEGRFQMRAGIMLVRECKLLLCQVAPDRYWFLPGGRVDFGESAEVAVQRELMEELGVTVRVERLRIVSENFFRLQGVENHELALLFDGALVGESRLNTERGPYDGDEGERKLVADWFSYQQLGDLDVRPPTIKPTLLEILAGNQPSLHPYHLIDRRCERVEQA